MNYTCGMSREHNGNHHQTSIPLTAFDHLYSMRHDAFFTVMINSMFFSFHFASSKQTNKQTLMKNKCANFFSTFRNSECIDLVSLSIPSQNVFVRIYYANSFVLRIFFLFFFRNTTVNHK